MLYYLKKNNNFDHTLSSYAKYTDISFKMVGANLEVYTVDLPTLKGLAMHNVLIVWKNSHFLRRIVCAFFNDAIFGHISINVNDQLNLNILQYIILCLQSILSVYLIIYTNIKLSTFYHSKKYDRSIYKCATFDM